ncbi:unnamed protein product, partial [Rotaria sp. Silwood1]
MDIQMDLLKQIQELKEENSEQSLIPIHVLKPAQEHVDGELEERLVKAKNDSSGQRIVLIPYNLGNFHLTGIYIKFQTNGSVERAEFINPVREHNGIPDQLQQSFNTIFQRFHLQLRKCEQLGGQNISGYLTKKYLLALVKETAFITDLSPTMTNETTQLTNRQEEEEQQQQQNIDRPLYSQ